MHSRTTLLLTLAVLLAACTATPGSRLGPNPDFSRMPRGGLVADAETAIRIAIAVWEPIYGKDEIQGQQPFRATLKDGVWIVRGSLPAGWVGGVAEVEIAQSDARILKLAHGK